MTYPRAALVLGICAALGVSSAIADPHFHGRHFGGGYYRHPSFGLYFGLPLWPRYYDPYPYYPYYPPAVVTVPSNPPVYIERSPPPVNQQLRSGYWYYCDNPQGYYPYVSDCPAGWRQVDPVPPQ